MHTSSSKRPYRFLISTMVLLSLTLSACSFNFGGSNTNVQPQGTPHNTSSTPQTTGILLGEQACPDAVKDAAHWNRVIHPGVGQTVEQVMCGNLIGASSLQAMVQVRHADDAHVLDVAVYDHITDGSPTQLFLVSGLQQGDARISGYNTLLTAQADPHSNANRGRPASQLVRDLFREFQWSDSAHTFIQTTFQSLFPDVTRYQAEIAQNAVNQGQGMQQWRLSVVQTTDTLVYTLLNWPIDTPVMVISGGGLHDYKAVVQVRSAAPGSGTIQVSYTRLEGNNNGGIWEATAITTSGLSITAPQSMQHLTSPVMVAGINTVFTGKTGMVKVLDYDHADIGHTIFSFAQSNFSSSISYSSSFQGEMREGVVALYTYNSNGSIVAAAMIKVLLSA